MAIFKHSAREPTAKDFDYVHPPPLKTFDPSISPSMDPKAVYHLVMKERLWKTWSGDSFGIRYNDGRPFEADVKGQALTFRDRLILRNVQGQPIGIMLSMLVRLRQTFKIYGFKPYMEGQEPSSQTHQGHRLYTWAEVVDRPFSISYEMRMVDGTLFVSDGVGSMFGLRKMRLTRNGKICALASQQRFFSGFRGNVIDLVISPGIDPCLIICFTAIIDEMRERASKSH